MTLWPTLLVEIPPMTLYWRTVEIKINFYQSCVTFEMSVISIEREHLKNIAASFAIVSFFNMPAGEILWMQSAFGEHCGGSKV